jgi:F-type H+-transporting ATPase subunit epsilon
MAKSFKLDVVTPEKNVYSGDITSVKIPASTGSFEVLLNHAPLIASLGKGTIRIIEENGNRIEMSVEGGVSEVSNNKVTVLVEKIFTELPSSEE